MGKVKFSIIMPVYNVERYIREAIESIINQTYGYFQLILVDDKSPDNCPLICDEYAEYDNRITVIHKQENQGLGMARNTGLTFVDGEYILFVDSDDTIEPNTLENTLAFLEGDTDILVFGMKRVYYDKNGKVKHTDVFKNTEKCSGSLKSNGKLFLDLSETKLFPYACNKVYRRLFLEENGAAFERTKLIEDFLFNIDLFSKAGKIKVISDCLYNYRKPAHETLANTYTPEFYDLAKRKFSLEKDFLKITDNNDYDSRQTVICSHIKHIISVLLRNRSEKADMTVKEQKNFISDVLCDETTIAALEEFEPKDIVFKIVAHILKQKKVNLCYVMVVFASLIKGR